MPPLTLPQARQKLYEVAGAVAVIQLKREDLIPRIPTCAARARQREQVGALRHTRERARLDGGRTDAAVAEEAKQLPEARNVFLDDRLERFRCHVAPGDAGAARRDHDVYARVRDQLAQRGFDLRLFVR